MTKNKVVIEKKQAAKIALFALLGSLPGAAAYTLVAQGDTVLWAQIERGLAKLVPEAQAGYTGIFHDFSSGWTRNPSGSVIIVDCDCEPPPPADCGTTFRTAARSGNNTYNSSTSSYEYGNGDDDDDDSDGSGCCLVAGTSVELVDGVSKPVEEIVVGEQLASGSGGANTVLELVRVTIGERGTFILNDGLVELTGDHPILLVNGEWRVCDLELLERVGTAERKALQPAQLEVGDVIQTADGPLEITNITHSHERPQEEIVYDFRLDGDHRYTAAGVILHNGCDDSSDDDSDDSF